MNYAYIRVSTQEQSYEGQRYQIEKWSERRQIVIHAWVQETVSGTCSLEKRTIGKLLRRMKAGDTLICCELSRLGRNMMMVMAILNTCSQKSIRLYSIKDSFELSDSLNAKIIAFAFSLAAEIERNLISQRTREALAAKKQAGYKLGRPAGASKQWKRYESQAQTIQKRIEGGETVIQIAKELGIHRNTLYRYLKTR